ncbi:MULTISPECIES: 4'-phosphopantetheinyl transferase family protein [unclassified Coleofasciculus]|uniref:4'-phosphopantetheinyl transferase family protein n=1 Tax=unclassified Coleofasciculus TaxID=2692782 RepID=UPI001882F908|nr:MULTISPECIES: 4'-phosphopantetheinyl transferase superfamily protein [unclassified Coleofasciculus]MBE9125652.1 4'-phosphopantetheinyl transferase superfamily protein [Coleofasciculus sp. LEGE 07081]MBE9148806.1 4'-phosphopantetheinyl transferase superfamily protein [Coleofasciculus sp. LEGE 07092]
MMAPDARWHPPPTDLVLSANDVHVWQANLNLPIGQLEKLTQTLSPDEQQRADRFYFERDRTHFIAGRGILRDILSRYLSLEPSQIQFAYSSRGKPALTNTNKRLSFNVSHSHELALYAISPAPRLGIDLEYMRPMPDAEKLAKRFFSEREYSAIASLPPEEQQAAFFNGWTRKEAYLKATGDGLTGLEEVEVSLLPGEPARLVSISGNSQAACRWLIYPLNPAPDYVAALAVEGQGWHLELFTVKSLTS